MEEYLKYLYEIHKHTCKILNMKPILKYKDLQWAYRSINSISELNIEECYFEENGKYVVKYMTKQQILKWKD